MFDTAFHLGQSHPGHWHQNLGGVAANVACHLQRFSDASVSFAGLFGDDDAAQWIQSELNQCGLQLMPNQPLQAASPSYTAIHQQDGAVIAGLSDMVLYRQMDADWAQKAAQFGKASSIWVVDTNMSGAALQILGEMKGQSSLYIVAVSPAKMQPVVQNIQHIDGLICNLAEARELLGQQSVNVADAARALNQLGLAHAIITDGANPCVSSKTDEELQSAQPNPIDSSAHLTGAGDAFAAAFLHSYFMAHPQNCQFALSHAVNCATLALQQPQTCPALSWQDIREFQASNE
ncbi:MAG: hypothetical protein COA52_17210 [Hyphomicrobiales bacterium]|nr:MAG: hypothetical protein COA52_17210 [Hyphomicrobiales bacterium]